MLTGSVIVVSYNSELCIEACLNALVACHNWNIVLVDNASQDRTLERARHFEPNILVLSNSENRGFAAAVNQGIRATESEVCVVLNPDVIANPNALQNLADALAPNRAGAAGGKLLHGGSPQRGFAIRRFPTLAAALCELLLVNRLWPRNPWNCHYRCLDVDYNRAQEIEQPAGACLALKRSAWRDLAGFDEEFFPVWFEDVDFCRRLRNRGWSITYCPQAVFLHSGGHSVRKLSFADRQCFWYENQLRYFSKHHSKPKVLVLQAAIAAGLLLRCMFFCFGFQANGTSFRQAVHGYCRAAWRCTLGQLHRKAKPST
ncbi:MAG: glycosyltransferase family 2 protein [Acidobacteria bacterium]|nr:glycosyltransferase family 2 protein [Acidobacteriota bacterium]